MEGQGQAQQEPNEPQPEQFCQLERQYKWAILISCLILIDLSIDAAHFDFSKKSTPVSNAPCSSRERLLPDWVWYYNIGYYYSEQRKNWTDSKKFCEVQGAQLAVLQDDFIKKNVIRFKKDGDDYWCGSYKWKDELKWLNEPSLEDKTGQHLQQKQSLG
ncbi:C-type lectin domain family 2 member B-like isoform X3 [Pyxicephalus adspersus]|uniref:C-type lectin domain family 2 member B-like isoform X3 n=1 Tax=Pyxicephalus adspersus TaxID=30357 RepID=UPI003B59A169